MTQQTIKIAVATIVARGEYPSSSRVAKEIDAPGYHLSNHAEQWRKDEMKRLGVKLTKRGMPVTIKR